MRHYAEDGQIDEKTSEDRYDMWLNLMAYQPPFTYPNNVFTNDYRPGSLDKYGQYITNLINEMLDLIGHFQKLIWQWASAFPQVIPEELESIPLLGIDYGAAHTLSDFPWGMP
jgi:hypothetical protein